MLKPDAVTNFVDMKVYIIPDIITAVINLQH